MEIAAFHDMTDMVALLIEYNVTIDRPRALEYGSEVREMILDYSTTLTREVVNRVLKHLNDETHLYWRRRIGPYKTSVRNSLSRWLVSHDYRRDASVCVAWTLSQLTGTAWPDVREPLLERLGQTRVREW